MGKEKKKKPSELRLLNFYLKYTENKKLSRFFRSLFFVYKSMSLKHFRIEQLCPSIYSIISLVFVHYAIM